MAKKTDAQLAKAELVDTLRTVVRLKHRAAMRRELNELESDALEAFHARLVAGEPYRIDPASILEAGE